LQQAYRRHGGVLLGIMQVVAAFTQINPLVLPVTMLPEWRLGFNYLNNNDLRIYTKYIDQDELVNINVSDAGVTIDPILYFPDTGTANLSWNHTNRIFTWTDTRGGIAISPQIPISGSTSIDSDTTRESDPILTTIMGPFDTSVYYRIVLGVRDRGGVIIDLTQSATLDVATLATDINTAFSADDRYDGYTVTATATGNIVSITAADLLTIYPSCAAIDASHIIFGIPWLKGTTSSAITINYGDTSKIISSTDLNIPESDGVNTYNITFNMLPTASQALNLEVLEISAGAWVKVNTTNVITTVGGSITIPINTLFWMTGQLPYEAHSKPLSSSIIISITDCSKLPDADTSDNITIGYGESLLPDDWWLTTDTYNKSVERGWMNDSSFVVELDTESIELFTQPLNTILNYKGYPIRVGAWVSHYLDVDSDTTTDTAYWSISFDGGDSWIHQSPATITSNVKYPTEISYTTILDVSSTSILFKLTLTSSSVTKLRIDTSYCKVLMHTATNLAYNTIPRNEHRSLRENVCYIWSPDALTTSEQSLIGLTSGTIGHLDRISPSYCNLERFNITELDGNNVVGLFTTTDFDNGTLTNLESIARSPSRLSYIRPTTLSRVINEVVYPATSAPYAITLSYISDQDLNTVILYEDGIPVLHENLEFVDETTIKFIDYTPSTTKSYLIDYNKLIQYTSDTMSLPTDYQEYIWFVDAYIYNQLNMSTSDLSTSVGIQFDDNYQASLTEYSDQNQLTSTLTMDNGTLQSVISIDKWKYIDSKTIQINSDVYDSNSIYTLDYTTKILNTDPICNNILEIRQADTEGGISTATYQEVSINDVVSTHKWFQMRLTLSNVTNVTNIRIYSLLLKGLNILGNSTIPILKINPDTIAI
jgi:hypothetical protein